MYQALPDFRINLSYPKNVSLFGIRSFLDEGQLCGTDAKGKNGSSLCEYFSTALRCAFAQMAIRKFSVRHR